MGNRGRGEQTLFHIQSKLLLDRNKIESENFKAKNAKFCEFCKEPLNNGAEVCKHCHAYLTEETIISISGFILLPILGFLGLAAIVLGAVGSSTYLFMDLCLIAGLVYLLLKQRAKSYEWVRDVNARQY